MLLQAYNASSCFRYLGQRQGHLCDRLAELRRIHVNAAVASPGHVTLARPVEDGRPLVVRGTVVPKWVHFDEAQREAVLALTVEGELMPRPVAVLLVGLRCR